MGLEHTLLDLAGMQGDHMTTGQIEDGGDGGGCGLQYI